MPRHELGAEDSASTSHETDHGTSRSSRLPPRRCPRAPAPRRRMSDDGRGALSSAARRRGRPAGARRPPHTPGIVCPTLRLDGATARVLDLAGDRRDQWPSLSDGSMRSSGSAAGVLRGRGVGCFSPAGAPGSRRGRAVGGPDLALGGCAPWSRLRPRPTLVADLAPPPAADLFSRADDLVIGMPGQVVGGRLDAGAVAVLHGAHGTGLSARSDQLWTLESDGIKAVAGETDTFGSARPRRHRRPTARSTSPPPRRLRTSPASMTRARPPYGQADLHAEVERLGARLRVAEGARIGTRRASPTGADHDTSDPAPEPASARRRRRAGGRSAPSGSR